MTTTAGASFVELEGDDGSMFYFQCPECGNRIKKRRDSFLPGAHVMICVLCHHTTSAINLRSGEHREVTAADHRGGGA